jgi:hypothetical protein
LCTISPSLSLNRAPVNCTNILISWTGLRVSSGCSWVRASRMCFIEMNAPDWLLWDEGGDTVLSTATRSPLANSPVTVFLFARSICRPISLVGNTNGDRSCVWYLLLHALKK